MSSSRRSLVIFGAVIGFLIVAAVLLVLLLPPAEAPPYPEDTPEGVVQRYLQALEAEDFTLAWGYLSPKASEDLTYETWLSRIGMSPEKPAVRVTLHRSSVTGNQASVEVMIEVFRPSGPFDSPVSTRYQTFILTRAGTGWKIISPTTIWWFSY